jgi:hypothetical protein
LIEGVVDPAHLSGSNRSVVIPAGGSGGTVGAARATYFMKRAGGESSEGREFTIGVFNKKANVGPLLPAFGFQFTFEDDRTLELG